MNHTEPVSARPDPAAAAARQAQALPAAYDALVTLRQAAGARPWALFLDLDGTLTPIAPRPEAIVISDAARDVLRRATSRGLVAIVSGRDVEDLQAHLRLDDVWYAGCHGMDIAAPDGTRTSAPGAEEARAALAHAADGLERRLASLPGAFVERKRYAVAAHYRAASSGDARVVQAAVQEAAAADRRLRATGGRKVAELRPAVAWDKGRAVTAILDRAAPHDPFPLALGDDLTDEDAFRAVDKTGVGIIVGAPPRTTWARYRLGDPDEAVRFLRDLLRLD